MHCTIIEIRSTTYKQQPQKICLLIATKVPPRLSSTLNQIVQNWHFRNFIIAWSLSLHWFFCCCCWTGDNRINHHEQVLRARARSYLNVVWYARQVHCTVLLAVEASDAFAFSHPRTRWDFICFEKWNALHEAVCLLRFPVHFHHHGFVLLLLSVRLVCFFAAVYPGIRSQPAAINKWAREAREARVKNPKRNDAK